MTPAPRRSRRLRDRPASGLLALLLLFLLALTPRLASSETAAFTADAPDGSVEADRLATSRLFYTAAERRSRRVDGEGEGHGEGDGDDDGVERVAPVPALDDAVEEPNGVVGERSRDRGVGNRGPGASVSRRASTDVAAGVRFQAMLEVGAQVRVVVGDRPCRDVGHGVSLICDALPGNIRALALDVDGRRLLATFADGSQRSFAVGMAIRQ